MKKTNVKKTNMNEILQSVSIASSSESFTPDETMILMLYARENREKTIQFMMGILNLITPEEKELSSLLESVIGKLEDISDSDFLMIPIIQEMFL